MEFPLLLHPKARAQLLFREQGNCLHVLILCILALCHSLQPLHTQTYTHTCACTLSHAHIFTGLFFWCLSRLSTWNSERYRLRVTTSGTVNHSVDNPSFKNIQFINSSDIADRAWEWSFSVHLPFSWPCWICLWLKEKGTVRALPGILSLALMFTYYPRIIFLSHTQWGNILFGNSI